MEKGGIFLIRVSYSDLGSLYFSTIQDFQLDEVYGYIKKNERIKEAMVLWTCNRFEIYFYPGDRETVSFLEDFVRGKSLKYSVIHGLDAVKHLFLVSAGLDSMVIGENEILAQVKQAWDFSKGQGMSGKNLNDVVKKAIEVGRKARRENGNGKRVKSVAGEALGRVRILPEERVILIGAGNLGTQIASQLSREGIHFSVSNRSIERAKEISKAFGADVEKFEKGRWLNYDVVITATKSPKPLLQTQDIKGSKVKTIIDLGVPPNVAGEMPKGVNLLSMETLANSIERMEVENTDYVTRSLKTVNDEFDKYSQKLMNVDKEKLLRKIVDYSNKVIEEEMTYFNRREDKNLDAELIRKGLESTRNKLLGFVINGIKNAKDIRSSETIKNMEMILDENFSRYEAKKVKKIR